MVQKKSKGVKHKGSSGGGKSKEPKTNRKPPPSSQLAPQDRVANVRPYWETLDIEARLSCLTVAVEELHDEAKQPRDVDRDIHGNGYLALPSDVSLPEVLQEGITRLVQKQTWKVWQWMPDSMEFYDADSFRNYLQEKVIPEDLKRLLPRDDGRPVEKPAEAALRQRMTDLLTRIQNHSRQYQEEPCSRPYRSRGRGVVDSGPIIIRDTNVEIITMILEALEREHEFVYQTMLLPITQFVCEVVPEDMRESTKTELYFEDLERMSPDDVVRIVEWLTEKVDAWGSKLKPEAKEQEEEDEEESMGDVDLFALTEDCDSLTVNAKWLQHLSERLLGDDGHPRKVQPGEDPHKMGLVLEWVYGSIVSTAEKARDSAKRALGSRKPAAEQAYTALMDALRDQNSWEDRARSAKDLMAEMLRSRKEAAEYQMQHAFKPAAAPTTALANGIAASAATAGTAAAAALRSHHLQAHLTSMMEDPSPYPDEVIIAMLRREVLLTRAKLHSLLFEHIMSEKQLRSLKAQLRQGEPEFDRLKRELEEVKHAPRGLDGTYRSAAEMERHRHQLADAAIEEQLEVQTAFREQGARLQQIYDRRQRTEQEIAKREQEISHLNGWRATVEKLLHQFEEVTANKPADATDDGSLDANTPTNIAQSADGVLARTSQASVTLFKLRNHFMKDVRKQLYTDDDDKMFFGWIQQELKQVEKRLEDGRAALQHLEMQLINVACDDPGAVIGAQLVLPILQERLDSHALDYHEEKAQEAEKLLIRMEAEKAAKEAAEKEKKAKQKQSKKGKTKTELERKAAEKAAKEAAQAERKAEEEQKRAKEQEEHRRQLRERMEQLRAEEEEIMEKRRQELLNDADGYWRQRMEEERAAQALLVDDRLGVSSEEQSSSRDTASSTDGAAVSSDDGFTPNIRRKPERPSKPHSPSATVAGERAVLKPMPNGIHHEHDPASQHSTRWRPAGISHHDGQNQGPPSRSASQDSVRSGSRFQPGKPAQRETAAAQDTGPRDQGHSQAASVPPAAAAAPAAVVPDATTRKPAVAGPAPSAAPTSSVPIPAPAAPLPNGVHHPATAAAGNARMKGKVYVPGPGAPAPQAPGRQVVLIHAPDGMGGRRRSDGAEFPAAQQMPKPHFGRPVPPEQELPPPASAGPAPSLEQAAPSSRGPIASVLAAQPVPPTPPPPQSPAPVHHAQLASTPQQQSMGPSTYPSMPRAAAVPHQQPAVSQQQPPAGQRQQPPAVPERVAGIALAAAPLHHPAADMHASVAPTTIAVTPPAPSSAGAASKGTPEVVKAQQTSAGGAAAAAVESSSSMPSTGYLPRSMPSKPHLPQSVPSHAPPMGVVPPAAVAAGAALAAVLPPGLQPPQPPGIAPGSSAVMPGAGHMPHAMHSMHAGRTQPPPPPPPVQQHAHMASVHTHLPHSHPGSVAGRHLPTNGPHLQHSIQGGRDGLAPRSLEQAGSGPMSHPGHHHGSGANSRHSSTTHLSGNMLKHSNSQHPHHHAASTQPMPPPHRQIAPDAAAARGSQHHNAGPVLNSKPGHSQHSATMHATPVSSPHHHLHPPGIMPPHHTPPSPRPHHMGAAGVPPFTPPHHQAHGPHGPGLHHRSNSSMGSAARAQYAQGSSPAPAPAPHNHPPPFNANSPAFTPTYPGPYSSMMPANAPAAASTPRPTNFPPSMGMGSPMPHPMVMPLPQFGQMPAPPPPPSQAGSNGHTHTKVAPPVAPVVVSAAAPPPAASAAVSATAPGPAPAPAAAAAAAAAAASKPGSTPPAKTSTLRAAALPFIPSNMRNLGSQQLPVATASSAALKKATDSVTSTSLVAPSASSSSRQQPPPPPAAMEADAPAAARQANLSMGIISQPPPPPPGLPSQPQSTAPAAAAPVEQRTAKSDVRPQPGPSKPSEAPAKPRPAASTAAVAEPTAAAAQTAAKPAAQAAAAAVSTRTQDIASSSQQPARSNTAESASAAASAASGTDASSQRTIGNSSTASAQSRAPLTDQHASSRAAQQAGPAPHAAEQPSPATPGPGASPFPAQPHQNVLSHAISSPMSSSVASPAHSLQSTPSWSSIAAKDAAATASTATSAPQPATPQPSSAGPAPGMPASAAATWRAPSETWKTKLTQRGQASGLAGSWDTPPSRSRDGAAGSVSQPARTGSGPSTAATSNGCTPGGVPSRDPVESGPLGAPKTGMPSTSGATGRSSRPASRQSSLARSTHANDDFVPASTHTAAPGKLQVVGGVTFEGFVQDVQQLHLIKGLVNDDGSYNCFLNVIIQSLWHLRGFRESMLALPAATVRATPAADVKVYSALHAIFKHLLLQPTTSQLQASAPTQSLTPILAGAPGAAAPSVGGDSSKQAPVPVKGDQGWVVNPVELREALSGLQQGQHTSVRIQLSEMHDASEVLGEVLNCLHRAEVGVCTDGASDMQLPKRVQVKKPAATPAAHRHSNGVHHPNGNPPASSWSAAAQNGIQLQQQQPAAPSHRSLVYRVFGLDVQVPAPPSSDDEEDEPGHQRRRQRAGAEWSGTKEDAKSVKSKEPKDPSMVEVHQYTKYFHLVPAQGLRQACEVLFDGSFEDVVREADAADTLLQRLKSGAGSTPHMSLLRRPAVFTLAIVWESPQAPLDAVKGTIHALAAELDLSQVFSDLPKGPAHRLRSVVCYFGHHYQVFVLSEELKQWLLFDDTTIKFIGTWRAVQATMVQQRLQPSLLFYEDCK